MKITENNKDKFFKNVKKGDVFTYVKSFFVHEIKRIALKDKVVVEYCVPGTKEYREHGCYTMKVTACEEKCSLPDNVNELEIQYDGGRFLFYINGAKVYENNFVGNDFSFNVDKKGSKLDTF